MTNFLPQSTKGGCPGPELNAEAPARFLGGPTGFYVGVTWGHGSLEEPASSLTAVHRKSHEGQTGASSRLLSMSRQCRYT